MNECRIIEDLLPLYTDGLLQEDTNEFVKLHLVKCAACSEKERQLKAQVEIPAPDTDGSRFRRVGKKLRLKAILISSLSIILAIGICFGAYTMDYFWLRPTRMQKNSIYALIENSPEAEFVGRCDDLVVPEKDGEGGNKGDGEGIRVFNGGISLLLPEGFISYQRLGQYVHYGSDDKGLRDYVSFYETDNAPIEFEYPDEWNGGRSSAEYFYAGWSRLRFYSSITRRMELAEYYLTYDFDSLTNKSPMEDLTIAFYLTRLSRYGLFQESDVPYSVYYRRITGRFSGYCFESYSGGKGWVFYLKDEHSWQRCYRIAVQGNDLFQTLDFKDSEEAMIKFLSGVEFGINQGVDVE